MTPFVVHSACRTSDGVFSSCTPVAVKTHPPQSLPGQETQVFLSGADLSGQVCVSLSHSGCLRAHISSGRGVCCPVSPPGPCSWAGRPRGSGFEGRVWGQAVPFSGSVFGSHTGLVVSSRTCLLRLSLPQRACLVFLFSVSPSYLSHT